MRDTKLLLILLIPIICLSCNQSKVKDRENTLTENHILVPGTKTSVIPPNNFFLSSSFSGFEDYITGSTIMIIEMPGSYNEMRLGLTRSALKEQGVIENSRAEFILNNYPAMLIQANQSALGTVYEKVILIFGNDNFTVIINGVCPSNNPTLKKKIEDALLTTVHDPNMEVNKEEVLDFELDLTGSKFQLADIMAMSAIYTVDGKVPTESLDESNILAGKSFSKFKIEDRLQFAIDRLDKLPPIMDEDPEIINEVTIDDLEGYEIFSYQKNENTGRSEFLYQVMLFSDYEYYIILGTTPDNFDENLIEFKKVAKSFKRK